jgi:hypothetical protein
MATGRPQVRIIATGGTMAGIGPHRLDYLLYSELAHRLTIEQMPNLPPLRGQGVFIPLAAH